MIRITRAKKEDLPAIRHLLGITKKMDIKDYHINNRDISLQARDDNGVLVGFLWLGLMCGNKLGYLDKFCVHPDYANKGIGKMLCKHMLMLAEKLGVKDGFAVILQDEFHERSAMSALRIGAGAHCLSYTYVLGSTASMIQALKELGE